MRFKTGDRVTCVFRYGTQVEVGGIYTIKSSITDESLNDLNFVELEELPGGWFAAKHFRGPNGIERAKKKLK